jgi:formylglycine-generating enzyme
MPDKPNILVIWGDDIGISNLSCYSDGLMGYRTPNIDRIATRGCGSPMPTVAALGTGRWRSRRWTRSGPQRMACAGVPGGTFSMGSADFYPEERPVHRVSMDGFWMDERPVTAAQFRRFVREMRYVTVAERPLDPARSTRTPIRTCSFQARRCSARPGSGEPRRLPELVGVRARCVVAESGRQSNDHQRPRPSPGRPGAIRGRCGVRRMGGQGTALRIRVGVRGAGRTRRRGLRVGRRALPRWEGDGEHLAGRVPWQNLKLDGFEGTSPVGSFPPNGYGLFDMTWQRVGVDFGLVHASAPARSRQPVLYPEQPRVTSPGVWHWSLTTTPKTANSPTPQALNALSTRRSTTDGPWSASRTTG